MKLIDTHNHLYLEDFDPEQDQLVTIAKESGIDTLLLPNVDTSTIRRMHDLCDRYPDFAYPMMGLHPTSVDEHYAKNLKETESWLGKRVYCGIGEIGIDLYWDKRSIRGTAQMEHRPHPAGRHSYPRSIPGSFRFSI